MLEHVLGQLQDPDEFLSKVQHLYSNPDLESADVLQFKDGRILERMKKVLREGDVIGRFGGTSSLRC